MDPAPPADVEGETKERRKIHFSVPATAPSQLDPRQVEMIRRRRPTPATLFRVADQSSPDDENATHQWVVGENGVLKPKRVNPNVYQPPSLKAVQRMAQAHMQTLGDCNAPEDPPEGEESEDCLSLGEREEESPSTPTADPQDLMDSQSERQSRSETGEEPTHRDEDEHEDEEEEEEKDEEEEEEEEEREKEQVEVGSEQGENEEARGRGE